jgi:ABC-2 type transport system permease protein
VNLAKIRPIVRREYLESVRKKSFFFGLLATPAIMIAMIYLPLAARRMVSSEEMRIALVDRAGGWAEEFRAGLVEEFSDTRESRIVVEIAADSEAPLSMLEQRLRNNELTGWILLPPDFAETGKLQYYSENVTDPGAMARMEALAGRILMQRKAASLGLDSAAADGLLRRAEMRTFQVGREGGKEADFSAVYLRAVTLVLILFFALMPTGQILMRSVIEEKSNRVIEVLLSSVTPKELMVGKIFGLGAVGLTLLGVWAACAALLIWRSGTSPWDARLVFTFLLYFIPGYFFYAAVLASVGSICTSEREAQPFLTPISLMLVFPVMIGIMIAQSPDHPAARVLSFIPFFTPSLMLFRHAIREPAVWETIATWCTLVASTGFMIAASARIFETGILLTGKRPTIPEVLRWLRKDRPGDPALSGEV